MSRSRQLQRVGAFMLLGLMTTGLCRNAPEIEHAREFSTFHEVFAAIHATGARYVVTHWLVDRAHIAVTELGGDVDMLAESVDEVAASVGGRVVQGRRSLFSLTVGGRHYFLALRGSDLLPRGWASAIFDRCLRWEQAADGADSDLRFFVPSPADSSQIAAYHTCFLKPRPTWRHSCTHEETERRFGGGKGDAITIWWDRCQNRMVQFLILHNYTLHVDGADTAHALLTKAVRLETPQVMMGTLATLAKLLSCLTLKSGSHLSLFVEILGSKTGELQSRLTDIAVALGTKLVDLTVEQDEHLFNVYAQQPFFELIDAACADAWCTWKVMHGFELLKQHQEKGGGISAEECHISDDEHHLWDAIISRQILQIMYPLPQETSDEEKEEERMTTTCPGPNGVTLPTCSHIPEVPVWDGVVEYVSSSTSARNSFWNLCVNFAGFRVEGRDSLADVRVHGILEVRGNGPVVFAEWRERQRETHTHGKGSNARARVVFLHTADEFSTHDTHWYHNTTDAQGLKPLVIRHYFDEQRLPPRGLWQVIGPGHLYPCFSELAHVCSDPHSSFMRKVATCLPPLPRTSQRRNHVCFLGFIHHQRAAMLAALERLQHQMPWLKVYTVKSSSFGGGLTRERVADVLMECQFGLAPCGNNPETHRLWEYLLYGVIPIIEHCPVISGRLFPPERNFLHWFSRDAWLTVRDWSHLAEVLLPHLAMPEENTFSHDETSFSSQPHDPGTPLEEGQGREEEEEEKKRSTCVLGGGEGGGHGHAWGGREEIRGQPLTRGT